MLCFSKNTDSLSVAPVRHPVVQISSVTPDGANGGRKERRAETTPNLREAPAERNQRCGGGGAAEMNVLLQDRADRWSQEPDLTFPHVRNQNRRIILRGFSERVQVQYFSTVRSKKRTEARRHKRCRVKVTLDFL